MPPSAALDGGDNGHSGSLGAQGEEWQQDSLVPRLSGWEQSGLRRPVGGATMETRVAAGQSPGAAAAPPPTASSLGLRVWIPGTQGLLRRGGAALPL